MRLVVLAAKVAVIVVFPLPEGSTVHQLALLLAVHAELEITEKVVVPADDITLLLDGETDRVRVNDVAVNEPAIPGA